MLVEHAFVTTLDYQTVVGQVATTLSQLGFQVLWQCESCSGENHLEYRYCENCREVHREDGGTLIARRGATSLAGVKHSIDLPQRLQLDFDRNRIGLAASLQEKRQATPIQRQMMLSLVSLIQLVACGQSPHEQLRLFQDICYQASSDKIYRQSSSLRILVGVLIFLVLLVVVLAIAGLAARAGR